MTASAFLPHGFFPVEPAVSLPAIPTFAWVRPYFDGEAGDRRLRVFFIYEHDGPGGLWQIDPAGTLPGTANVHVDAEGVIASLVECQGRAFVDLKSAPGATL